MITAWWSRWARYILECEVAHLHALSYADTLVRNPSSLEPAPDGAEGLIQVLSVLPKSYPGHSILTEGLGTCVGCDDCACGQQGACFAVSGWAPTAVALDCSDTYVAPGVRP